MSVRNMVFEIFSNAPIPVVIVLTGGNARTLTFSQIAQAAHRLNPSNPSFSSIPHPFPLFLSRLRLKSDLSKIVDLKVKLFAFAVVITVTLRWCVVTQYFVSRMVV
jgi:hypothetical protein